MADSCGLDPLIPDSEFSDSDLVFVGKAKETNIRITEVTETVDITIDVLEIFKGDLSSQIVMDGGQGRLHTIYPGDTHLLYLRSKEGRKPWPIDCWSGDINKPEFKQILDELRTHNTKPLNQ